MEPETGVFDEHLKRMPEAQDLLPGSGSWFSRMVGEINRRYAAQQVVTDFPMGPWASLAKWMGANKTLENLRINGQYVPISWPGEEHIALQNREEVGRLMGQNVIDLVNAWRPTILKGGVSDAEVDYWITETTAEMDGPRVKSYFRYHYFTAKARQAAPTG